MNTPRAKYVQDATYKSLVDTLVSAIHQCKFTPSELREAAILACIIYEETKIKMVSISKEGKKT